ncbi:hypothetical protein HDU78_009917 [Chytriomyces hyalinus]|nr:hypothetical protein HDU78_009917 [Chytriomyces hyalinus]
MIAPDSGNSTYAQFHEDPLDTQWNAVTIIVSIAISYAGAMYTILLNEARARVDPPLSKFYSATLLLLSSLSLSIRTIFFMHFVGMTAITLHVHETGARVPIYFEYGYTVLSAILCSVTILWAFYFASQDEHWNSIVHDRTKLAERIMARAVAKTMAVKKKADAKLKKGPTVKTLAVGQISSSAALPRISGTTRGPINSSLAVHAPVIHESKPSADFDTPMDAIVESAALLPNEPKPAPPQTPESTTNLKSPSIKTSFLSMSRLSPQEKAESSIDLGGHSLPGKSPAPWGTKAFDSLPKPRIPPPHMPAYPIGFPNSEMSLRYDVAPALPNRDRISVSRKDKESMTQLESGHHDTTELELTIDILILFEKPWRIIISGFFIALAVLGMHYMGMLSMRMQAEQIYNPVVVFLSVVIAVVAATAGMFIIFRILPYYPYEVVKYTAAVIIAIAVNGMHYTGMAAVSYTVNHIPDFDPSGYIEPVHLAEVILYSEVIINIVSEAVLRQDNDLVLNLYRARAQAAFGSSRGSALITNNSRRPSFHPV